MEALLFDRIINFKNICEIKNDIRFFHYTYDRHSCLDETESMWARISVKYVGDKYFRDIDFYFKGYKDTDELKKEECVNAFNKFLTRFDNYVCSGCACT